MRGHRWTRLQRAGRLLALGGFGALCLASRAGEAAAQATQVAPAPTRVLSGTVTSVADALPVPFALVRIVTPGDTAPVPRAVVREAISNANGRYDITDLPEGVYRLQVARIGFRPVVSGVVRVGGGTPVRFDMQVPSRAVQLAAVRVLANPPCVTGASLASEPHLLTLWTETQKGVRTRSAFEREFRFRVTTREEVTVRWRFKRDRPERRVSAYVNEPDSVDVRDRRLRARRAREGYVRSNMVALPDERDLLADDFLRGHCLESQVADSAGALGLRFRPVAARSAAVDIRGAIWIEPSTYQIERLDIQYLEGGKVYAGFRIAYADVAVGPASLRLRTRGDGVLHHLRGQASVVAHGARSRFTYEYSDVVQTAGQPR